MAEITIHSILAQFRDEELHNRHLGDRFERLICRYLELDPNPFQLPPHPRWHPAGSLRLHRQRQTRPRMDHRAHRITIDNGKGRSGIKNDPNDWCREHDNPRYIIDIIKRVTSVSVETMKIVNALPALNERR